MEKTNKNLEHYIQEVSRKERFAKRRQSLVILFALCAGTAGAVYAFWPKSSAPAPLAQTPQTPALPAKQFVALRTALPLEDLVPYFEQPDMAIVFSDSLGQQRDTFFSLEALMLEGQQWIAQPDAEEAAEKDWAAQLQRLGISIVGQPVAGQPFVLVLKNFDPAISYEARIGSNAVQRLSVSNELRLPSAGRYTLKLSATAPDGSRRDYSEDINVAAAPVQAPPSSPAPVAEAASVPAPAASVPAPPKPAAPAPVVDDSEQRRLAERLAQKPQATPQPAGEDLTAKGGGTAEAPFVESAKMPEFQGGTAALSRFLSKEVKYPRQAKEMSIQGRVIVTFDVEEDGSLSNFKVARGIGYGCDEEALRVAKKMPKWTPGEQNGRKAKVGMSVPIVFRLTE